MIILESLLDKNADKDGLAQKLTTTDINLLTSLLDEKNDDIRYASFLVLKNRSEKYEDVYGHWDIFCEKLYSDNSYQRSIGIMLLAENIRWDKDNRFDDVVNDYLEHCKDEKFITSRQTIQSIKVWIHERPDLRKQITDTLLAIDLNEFKETQRKLILIDILTVLIELQKVKSNERVSNYINKAFTDGMLDKKAMKEIEKLIEE